MKRACVLFVLATGFAAALLATSVLAAPGDLYVGDFNSGANAGTIFKFTPDGTKSIFAIHVGGLIHSAEPAGLAFDGFGNLFEAEPDSYFGGTIFKFTPTGDESSFGVEISSPGSLAFDIEGNLFVSDPGFIFAIIKIRPDGTQTTFVGLATARDALAFDAQGDLFGVGAGAISKFAPDGTESIFASGLNPTGLAFDSQGNLFVSDVGDRSPGSGSILKFTPAGSKSIFASGLSDPRGLAFDSMGNLFEADFNSGTIFKFSPDGKKSIFASGLDGPVSLAFQPIVVQLGNLSTRGHVQTGNNVLIGGFVIGGTVPKPVLIRAVGPSLANFGVADSLQNPTISLFHGNSQIAAMTTGRAHLTLDKSRSAYNQQILTNQRS